MDKKITVIGAGHVGATVAQLAVQRELADVVLVDVVPGLAKGKALDINEAAPVGRYDARVTGSDVYDQTADSNLIVITAGLPRKPGMSRDDLLLTNAEIVSAAARQSAARSPHAIIVVVSNPMDAMCHVAMKASGFPPNRILGMAGVLDSARLCTFIAEELQVSVENTHAFVLGAHGDAMVPLARFSTVAGIPITQMLSAERIAALVERTRNGGSEVVGLLKHGGAYYAPGAAVIEMIDAILKDKKKILPCAAYLNGAYGIDGLFMGVPVKLGVGGVEDIIEIKMTSEEAAAFQASAAAVARLVSVLEKKE